MTEHLLLGLSGIIVLGIFAQWLAWRLKIPSILLLLFFGFMAGPITGFISPDEIFGEGLFPFISLSVAVILFEGGLSLKFFELKATGSVVHRLITLGALVSWGLGTAAAYYILGLDLPMAVLLGSIVLVTGPTVIGPLLSHVRPAGKVASVLRWEGILIDPVGAVLAVLVYEAIIGGRFHQVPSVAVMGIFKTMMIGGGAGLIGAAIVVLFLRFYWAPDFLQSPMTLMSMVLAFTVSNMIQSESGLLAVTIMGVALANQKFVTVEHIIEFKENLRVLLIAGLFIILAARLDLGDLRHLGFGSFFFLFLLIFVVRPLSVFVSTVFSDLDWKEKVFIAFVAPRGIVAAAVSSVFSLRMMDAGYANADELAPVTFFVIAGTVIFYGLGAPAIARRLKLSQANPQGMLFVGAYPWAVALARAVKDAGFKVLLADTNWNNINAARMSGLPVYYGSVLSEAVFQESELEGVGRLLAFTPNYGVNSLSVLHFNKVFESSELYQLVPQKDDRSAGGKGEAVSKHLHGRFLFGKDINFPYLTHRFYSGAVVKKTRLTEKFDFEAFRKRHGPSAVPLFLITGEGVISVFTTGKQLEPGPGDTLLSLVDPEAEGREGEGRNGQAG
ncbi:MAG: sodium:proton antiporter [Deltaproteobacteria bacterium]|nr:sodium:proton antiporter [Deltaproteobacteria bacterium]